MRVWTIFFNRSDRPHDESMILGGRGPGFSGRKEVVDKADCDIAVEALQRIAKTRTRDPLTIEYRAIAREALKKIERKHTEKSCTNDVSG